MKKFLKALSLMFLICFSLFSLTAKAQSNEPDINAEGAILIDASSGTVLFGKNENETFEPASTTKVMTALIALEKCKLDETVKVTQDFTEIDGTAVGLLKNDELTVRDLLLGLLMESGNDCANALAIHISGSIEDFGKLMTEKAKELGATKTTFKNPSGLPDEKHLTTPHDLALIMREAIKNEEFVKLTQVAYYEIKMKNSDRILIVNNKNHMINKNSKYYYEYAICGKNGYTLRANHTYVCAAKKDGHTLVAAYLNAQNKPQNFQDMKDVFDYGFNNYTWVNLYKENTEAEQYKVNNRTTIPLVIPQNIDYVVQKGENTNVTPQLKIEDKDLSKTSFNKGDSILKGTISVNGKEYMETNLLAGESYEYKPLIPQSASQISPIKLASIVAGAAVGLALIVFSIRHLYKSKKQKFDDSFDSDDYDNYDDSEKYYDDENVDFTQVINIPKQNNNDKQ